MDHRKFLQSLDKVFSDDEISLDSSTSSEMAGPELAKVAGQDGKPFPAGTIAKLVSIFWMACPSPGKLLDMVCNGSNSLRRVIFLMTRSTISFMTLLRKSIVTRRWLACDPL